MASIGQGHNPEHKIFSFHRPVSRPNPSGRPISLLEASLQAVTTLLCKTVQLPLSWNCQAVQVRVARAYLSRLIGEVGPIHEILYRYIFMKECPVQISSETLWFIPKSVGHLGNDVKTLSATSLFALWWIFVPQGCHCEVTYCKCISVALDLPGQHINNRFYGFMLGIMACTKVRLRTLTLKYKSWMRADAKAALQLNAQFIQSVTLVSGCSDQIVMLLAKHCKLKSFEAGKSEHCSLSTEAIKIFLIRQRATLESLKLWNDFLDIGPDCVDMYKCLETCKKLSHLSTSSISCPFWPIDSPPAVLGSIVSVEVKQLRFPSCFEAIFPSCQMLTVVQDDKIRRAGLPSEDRRELHLRDLYDCEIPMLHLLQECRGAQKIRLKRLSAQGSESTYREYIIKEIAFPNLTHINLEVEDLDYHTFSVLIFGAPCLQNLQLMVLQWFGRFDTDDFVSRLNSGRMQKYLQHLRWFVLTYFVSLLTEVRALTDERVPMAIMEAAGSSLQYLGDLFWCQPRSQKHKKALIDKAASIGLTKVKMVNRNVEGLWNLE